MSSTSDALRATSDALLRDLEVLGTLEDEKRSISPGDPRLVDLAAQIEEIAKRVLAGSRREHEITKVANAQVRSGAETAPNTTIEATQRLPSEILAEWRAAERRRASADPQTAEWTEADALVDHLRDEYRLAFRSEGA